MNEKVLKLDDSIEKMDDSIELMQNKPMLRGKVEIFSEDGSLLLSKDNLVVQRGRTFVLEKLFNDVNPDSTGYTKNLNREIVLFGVGTGGADVGTPFEPRPVLATDYTLTESTPFRIEDSNDTLTYLTDDEKKIYHNPIVEDNLSSYMYKRFEIYDPEWKVDKDTNTIYKKIELRLNEKDTRDKAINELALFIAQKPINEDENYVDVEMFSKINFPSEYMSSDKQLLVRYYVYV